MTVNSELPLKMKDVKEEPFDEIEEQTSDFSLPTAFPSAAPFLKKRKVELPGLDEKIDVRRNSLRTSFEKIQEAKPNWKLVQKSDWQWSFMGKEPNFLLPKLKDNMSLVKDRDACQTTVLESILTFTIPKKVSTKGLYMEERHQLKMANQPAIHLWTQQSFILKPYPQEILHSWELQLALLDKFFNAIAEFLESRALDVFLKHSKEGLVLKINGVKMLCELMPKMWLRPLVTATFANPFEKVQVKSVNFDKNLAYIRARLEKGPRSSPTLNLQLQLSQRQKQLQNVLDPALKVRHQLVMVALSDCVQKVSSCKLLSPMMKIGSRIRGENRLHGFLESSLTITLLANVNDCLLCETHIFRGQNDSEEPEKLEWVQKDMDSKIFPNISYILESWSKQLHLIDLLFTHLALFMETRGLLLDLVSPFSVLKKLILRADKVEMTFQLFPGAAVRPTIGVGINKFGVHQIKDLNSLSLFLQSLSSFLPPKLSVVQLVGDVGFRQVDEPEEANQVRPSPPEALMKELNSTLTSPSPTQAVTNLGKDRAQLFQKLEEWKHSGCSAMHIGSSSYIITASSGKKKLTVDFKELKGIVRWKLSLTFLDSGKAKPLCSNGLSSNFYLPLISCLQHFLDDKPCESQTI